MLTTQNLSYRLRGKLLIDSLNMQFKAGLIYAILGPNGSGKTTFLKTLAGIWKATSGTVQWLQRDLLSQSRQEISRILTLVPQNPQVTFDFTVKEFVAMGRYIHGTSKSPTNCVEAVLQQVDAWQFRHRPINQLSQGERQRVYIARSLATEAPVLLFDEPVAHLDLRHQKDIWVLMKDLARQGKTILVSNHDLIHTEKYCDHLYLLHKGQCIAEGSFKEVIVPTILEEVFGVGEE